MTSSSPSGHRRRRAKGDHVGDGSCSATESTVHVPAGESTWRDWASLACGPAWQIADRVLSRDVADYVRLRAVCTAWRGCTADPRGDALDRRFHPRRWVMLQDVVTGGKRPRYRHSRFLNVRTREEIRMTIRGLSGHDGRIRIACTSVGLLGLLNKKTHDVFVLNPVTGARTDLPPVTSLLSSYRQGSLFPRLPGEVHLAAELTGDSAVVILFSGRQLMGVARPGDQHWAKVKCPCRIEFRIAAFAGDVYCSAGRTAMVLELSPDDPPRLVKAACNSFWIGTHNPVSALLYD